MTLVGFVALVMACGGSASAENDGEETDSESSSEPAEAIIGDDGDDGGGSASGADTSGETNEAETDGALGGSTDHERALDLGGNVVVFVSDARTIPADMGGVVGADQICQAEADAAGLNGTFLAWLSTSTIDASQRLPVTAGSYVRPDGQSIASSTADFVDGSVLQVLDVNAAGVAVSGAGIDKYVWTGTTDDGATSDATCDDWAAGSSAYGSVGQTDALTGWSASGLVGVCDVHPLRLFCVGAIDAEPDPCGDSVCDAGVGEDCVTCSEDCRSCYADAAFFSVHEHGGSPIFGEPTQNPDAWTVLDGNKAIWPDTSWNILSTAYMGAINKGLIAWDPGLTSQLEPNLIWWRNDNVRAKNAVEAKRLEDSTLGPADVPGGVSWFGSVTATWDVPFDENWVDAYKLEVDQLFDDGAYGIKDHPTFVLLGAFNLANGFCNPVASGTACTNQCGDGETCRYNGFCSEGGRRGSTTPCTDDFINCSDAEETCHGPAGSGAGTCDFEGVRNVMIECLQEDTVVYPLLEPAGREVLRYITHDKAKPVIWHPHSNAGPDGVSRCFDPVNNVHNVRCDEVFQNVFFDFANYVSASPAWTAEGKRRFIMAHGFTENPYDIANYPSKFQRAMDAGLSVDMNTKPENHQQMAGGCDTNPMCGCEARAFFRKPEWADNILVGVNDSWLWENPAPSEEWSIDWNHNSTEDILFQAFESTDSVQSLRSTNGVPIYIRGADLTEPSSVAAGCCTGGNSQEEIDCRALYDVPEGIVDRYLLGNADELLTPTQRVFLSNEEVRGNLDFGDGPLGVAGADASCQAQADLAELGGTYYAMLSTSTVHLKDRVDASDFKIFTEGGTTYKNAAGDIVAIGATDLFDGTLDAGVNYDASGNEELDQTYAWSGSYPDGTRVTDGSCDDWSNSTSGTPYGVVGDHLQIYPWLGYSYSYCHSRRPFYCIEAPVR